MNMVLPGPHIGTAIQTFRYGARNLPVLLLVLGAAALCAAQTGTAPEVATGTSDPDKAASPANQFLYRLEEHLADAVVKESAAPASDKEFTIPVWPVIAPPEAPQASNATVAVEGGVLKTSIEGPGSVTFPEGLGIYTPSADSLVLRLRLTGPAALKVAWRYRLFNWREMEEMGDCSFSVPVIPDNEPHTYVVRLDNMDAWRKYRTVDGLRLETGEAASIEIEEIKIQQRLGLFAEEGVGTREYSVDGETRQALFMHTPARMVYRLTLPERPVFTAGLTVVQDDNPVKFVLSLARDGGRTVLFEADADSTGGWKDQRVDLSAYAGTEVEMELSAESAVPGQIALWGSPSVYSSLQKDTPRSLPNILVYLVDALRADHLNAYGYGISTSLNLARLAEKGTVFQNCFSQETCTKPSVMTLHTGIDLIAHGYTCNQGPGFKTEPGLYPAALREIGYATCAISQNSYAPPVSFTQKAFCRLVELHEVNKAVTEDTFKTTSAFLEQHQDRPFYLYVHTMECHEQWTATSETQEFAPPARLDSTPGNPAETVSVPGYDASIAFADGNFERIRTRLEELGLLANTLILFTADHGYALGERGEWEHGKAPYLDQIHIPLIMSWPAGPFPSAKIAENVQTADISATILDLVGLPNPGNSQGLSLLPLMRGERTAYLERPIFSFGGWNTGASVIRGHLKLLKDRDGRESLYDIANGAPESDDLAAARPDLAAELHQELKTHVRRNTKIAETIRSESDSKEEVEVDPVKLEILKSLGYIQ